MLPSANDVMLRINDVGCAQRCLLRKTMFASANGQSLRHDFVVPPPFTQGRLGCGGRLGERGCLRQMMFAAQMMYTFGK